MIRCKQGHVTVHQINKQKYDSFRMFGFYHIMIKSLLSGCIALLAFSFSVSSQSVVRFKTSKPYSVFNFLEVAGGAQSQSSTYRNYVDTSVMRHEPSFAALANAFQQLNLSYSYRRDEFPSNRRQTRSTYDLIVIAAVKSASVEEFRMNTIGILPNSTHQQMCELMKKAEPFYDRYVWRQSEKATQQQINGFRQYAGKANQLFRAFRNFYHSSWPDNIPFDVAVFPIPAKSGNTTATPHANSLCVSVLTGGKDPAGSMGVTMHEICHVLYDEQTSDFQHQVDEWFTKSASPFRDIAYSFFDEALATVLGNGWAYEDFTGKPDTTAWYNNEYINGFAHALHPLIKEYLTAGKPMDSLFVENAIASFGKAYPRSLADYSILLNNMYLYSDAEERSERQRIKNVLGKYFQSSRYSFSSPILHEYSIDYIKNSKGTQLLIVDHNQDSTISELKKVIPDLNEVLKSSSLSTSLNYIASFYDNRKRTVILVRVTGKEMLDKAFRVLKEKKYLEVGTPVFAIE